MTLTDLELRDWQKARVRFACTNKRTRTRSLVLIDRILEVSK